VTIGSAGDGKVDQSAEGIQCRPARRPRKAGMPVGGIPEAHCRVHERLVVAVGVHESAMLFRSAGSIFWPDILRVREHLHHLEMLELLQRLKCPVRPDECEVGVDPREVLRVRMLMDNMSEQQIERVLLVPELARGPELKMVRIAGIANHEQAIDVGYFDCPELDVPS
jgi:hypothetical protein